MKYSRVHLESMGYELAPNVVTSSSLEARMKPLYERLHLQQGQLEALTGIRERRWWDSGHANASGAIGAGRRALEDCSVQPGDIGALIYGGVCRDHLEPATACRVADELGVSASVQIYDVSNACLGAVNGLVEVANRIELGQIRAGLIVSCESAREINESTIERLNAEPTMEGYKLSLATFTGGSGAVAFILTDGSFAGERPRLKGGVARAAPEHHRICRWDFAGPSANGVPSAQYAATDAVSVLKYGVALGAETWRDFLAEMQWKSEEIDRVICHQIGSANRETMLRTLGVPEEKDFSTFEYLGNTGTVALPLTAALADERDFLERGDRVAFLGIGSGLNCIMLGWDW